jgi:hypothetical protein
MWWRNSLIFRAVACSGLLAVSTGAAAAEGAATGASASYEAAAPVLPSRGDLTSEPAATTEVRSIGSGKGFLFRPSPQPLGKFRFGVGGLYDAVDPAVMYGMTLRLPQVTADARFGLGKGWSLKGHLNSMLITNEFMLGGAYSWQGNGPWSVEVALSGGIYVGKLAQLAFDAVFLSPEYRPELTIGYDIDDDVTISLRGTVLLMGPERVRVGEVWGGLDNSNLFAGHSEMLYVENVTSTGSVWYFALGAMTTRAYYQMWLLFPDAPGLYTYARTTVGYEF